MRVQIGKTVLVRVHYNANFPSIERRQLIPKKQQNTQVVSLQKTTLSVV